MKKSPPALRGRGGEGEIKCVLFFFLFEVVTSSGEQQIVALCPRTLF